jgi:hypothetical protein
MPDVTLSSDQLDELIGALYQLANATAERRGLAAASTDEQTALFAYQWINGSLGRSDVVPPIVQFERRTKSRLMLATMPPAVTTHARIYAHDGTVEEIEITDVTKKIIDLTSIPDDVPISFVEFRTAEGAPVAIVTRIPAI